MLYEVTKSFLFFKDIYSTVRGLGNLSVEMHLQVLFRCRYPCFFCKMGSIAIWMHIINKLVFQCTVISVHILGYSGVHTFYDVYTFVSQYVML